MDTRHSAISGCHTRRVRPGTKYPVEPDIRDLSAGAGSATARLEVAAAGSQLGADGFGDVEREDLGAGRVEVEAVLGADVFELRCRAGPARPRRSRR